jgi:hypothetical protein
MALPQAMPIKLPQAPQQYDKRDQDHTRRLIELLLAQTGLGISSLGEAITVTPASPRVWTPQSPIIASTAIAMVTNSALIQLLNPPGSQRNIVIYELYCLATQSQITQRMRITSQPFNLSAVSPSPTMRMDERDATSVIGLLKATQGVSAFATGQSQWVDQPLGNPSTTQYKQIAIISQSELGDQPIVLAPGQAVEFTEGTTGTGPTFGLFVVWDEISTGVPLPVSNADNPTNIINAVMGSAFVATGNRNFAQLLNPSYSPKVLRVKSIRVWGDVSNTRCLIRKTREPLHVSANPSASIVKFADGTSADSIYGQVNSSTQPLEGTGAQWTEADSFWFDKFGVVSGTGALQQVLLPLNAPIFLKPGSAIEVQPGDTVTNLFANFIWDEIDL